MVMEDALLAGLGSKKNKADADEKARFGKVAELPPKDAVQSGGLPPAASPAGKMEEVLTLVGSDAKALITPPPTTPEPDAGSVNPPDAPAPAKKKRKAATRKPTGTLYIGCCPVGEKVMPLEEITEPLLAGIAEEKGKAHYLAVEFGKWKGPFSAALIGWLDANPLPKALLIMPHAPCASVAAEILRPRFPHVVERLG